MSDMGILTITVGVESPLRRGEIREVHDVLVDTGPGLSWLPASILEGLGIAREKRDGFTMANGGVLVRDIGFAIIHVAGRFTNDEVIFGEPGDLVILGTRSLEGLNLRVDARNQRLIAAGPILAAAGGRTWPTAYWERLDGLPPLSEDFAAP